MRCIAAFPAHYATGKLSEKGRSGGKSTGELTWISQHSQCHGQPEKTIKIEIPNQ
jgi:hypothetical protein